MQLVGYIVRPFKRLDGPTIFEVVLILFRQTSGRVDGLLYLGAPWRRKIFAQQMGSVLA